LSREIAEDDPLRGNPRSKLPEAADVADLAVPSRISAGADIGHVNLRVVDLERSLAFYRDVIGLSVTQQDEASVFLAAGDYHHHVALNIWGPQAGEAGADAAGLHHFALRLPDTVALAEVVARLLRAGHPLLGATDHGVNIAVYLSDPDGNGVELMVDRPEPEWPRGPGGEIAMRVDPLDLRALVTEALPAATS
jgi:catechol 2,3-dioxygenase